jgi:hypothetical protein
MDSDGVGRPRSCTAVVVAAESVVGSTVRSVTSSVAVDLRLLFVS